jgi:hypothetical protein
MEEKIITSYELLYEKIMNEANDLPLSEALARKLIVMCPTCGIYHPGIRYFHPDHTVYCSKKCYKKRKRFDFAEATPPAKGE